MLPARIVALYLKICGEMDFKPATERTLLIILEVCAASTRKRLQGPDNYTADGSEAFKHSEVIEKPYDEGMSDCEAQKLCSMAFSCKRYLKQDCERFEPRNHFKSRLSLIVRVNVVLNRTVVVDSD